MYKIFIRFYEELNFFLSPKVRKKEFKKSIISGTSVKALIEELGVPHTEVDLILVNGKSVDFSYQLNENDRISVYPVFETFNISKISKVRPQPLRVTKFILDVHLGKLVKRLRLLGFDSLYSNSYDDKSISLISQNEKRIILTRDIGLLKRKIITHGCYIRSKNPQEQLIEVLNRFNLLESIKPFSRCLQCNSVLEGIEKQKILKRLPEAVKIKYNKFSFCKNCDKIYWIGTHWDNFSEKLYSANLNVC